MRHAAALALALAPAAARGASLSEFPTIGGVKMAQPFDISGNGLVVVGYCTTDADASVCRYSEAGGYQLLETPEYAVEWLSTSRDGSVVVGTIYGPVVTGVRWDAAGDLHPLSAPAEVGGSDAIDVSADGRVIVGGAHTDSPFSVQPFRWTAAGGMELLPVSGFAFGVDADGDTIVGHGMSRGPLVWRHGEGFTVLANPSGYDFAMGVSGDGAVVVGGAIDIPGNPPWRWTETSGFEPLDPTNPFSVLNPVAFDASSDGSVIVGVGSQWSGSAFVWEPILGRRPVLAELAGHGVPVSQWIDVSNVFGVSEDGRRMAGLARRDGEPFGVAVLIDLTPACDDGIDNDSDGHIDLADVHCTFAGRQSEAACGTGFEIAFAIVPLALTRRRLQRRA